MYQTVSKKQGLIASRLQPSNPNLLIVTLLTLSDQEHGTGKGPIRHANNNSMLNHAAAVFGSGSGFSLNILPQLQHAAKNMAKSYPPVQPGGSLILAWQIKGKKVLVVGGGEVRHETW